MTETEFAYRIRQALNEGAERLDYRTTYRLEQARAKAVAAKRAQPDEVRVWVPALQPAGAPADSGFAGLGGWLRRAGLVAPLFALVVGFVGIYQWQRDKAIERTADLDLAVLMDDAPLDTFADSGFGVLLRNQGRTNPGQDLR